MTSVRIEKNVEMTTRDGVILRADVYRPETDTPTPAIVMRTPYDKSRSWAYPLWPALRALEHGFAYVIQDFRGRHASDGAAGSGTTAGMDQMAMDGFDCIEWVRSEPWCDGNVGMAGGSAVAAAQITTAWTRPPGLRAIAPAVPGGGREKTMALETNIVGWTALMAMNVIERRRAEGHDVTEDVMKVMAVDRDVPAACWTLPLSALPTMNIEGMPTYEETLRIMSAAVDSLMGHEGSIEVPALLTSGWYDPTRTTGFFTAIREGAGSDLARSGTKLVMGPWGHGEQTWNLGEWGFGRSASPSMGGVPIDAHLQFYNRHVKGDTAVEELPTVRYFVMGSNVWKDGDSWPLPGTDWRPLYLRSGFQLSWQAPEAEAPDRFDYDPAHPVPSHGARVMYVGGGTVPGPFDQSRIERRPDVLVYTTDELTEPVEIAGPVTLRLFFSSSAVDTDVVAKLCVVDVDGVSVNLADGILRARHRDDWDVPSFLVPDEIYELSVDLGPTAYHFRPGQRIRLQVTSSCFPLWERNMNTGNAPGTDTVGVVAEQTVHHAAETPSQLVLPVQAVS